MAFQYNPTPTWRADPRTGMVALAGNKIVMPGSYNWPNSGNSSYKILQSAGPGHRLFRNYASQIPGKGDAGKLLNYWKWSPKSDTALWQGAQQTALRQQTNAAFTPAAASPLTGALAGRVAKNTTGGLTTQGGTAAGGGAASGGAAATAGGVNNPWLTDPGYLSALAAEQTGSMQADKALAAAQEQAITQFGDPAWAQAQGLNVSPLTAAAANANTLAGNSTVAGLQRTRDDNQQNILDTLSAHGVLDSGQTLYATGRNQQAYGTDLYNAEQTALGGLNTAQATDVSAKQGLHSDVTKALLQAYQTYTANPQYWGAANPGGVKAAANANATAPADGLPPAVYSPTFVGAPISGSVREPYTGPVPASTPFVKSGGLRKPYIGPVATALARPPAAPTAQVARNVSAG